mmetsp:Transcript_765/g.1768  ORF Transcript_765/g.1768 Transcript_765/m.1768 type:complete len:240 (-) Transcript_765:264-983(-)
MESACSISARVVLNDRRLVGPGPPAHGPGRQRGQPLKLRWLLPLGQPSSLVVVVGPTVVPGELRPPRHVPEAPGGGRRGDAPAADRRGRGRRGHRNGVGGRRPVALASPGTLLRKHGHLLGLGGIVHASVGELDLQRSNCVGHHMVVVERLDCRCGCGGRRHLHEGRPLASASLVPHHEHLGDFPVAAEQGVQFSADAIHVFALGQSPDEELDLACRHGLLRHPMLLRLPGGDGHLQRA